MQKSTARKALEIALAEATTPAERAEIATQLSRLTERESRTRARQKRLSDRAKRQAAAAPPPAPDDGAAPFVLHTPEEQAAIEAAEAHNRAKQAEAATALVPPPTPPEAPAVTTLPAPRARPVNGAGWSRTLTSWEPPTWYSESEAVWLGRTENGAARAHRPEWSPDSPELFHQLETTGLTFVDGAFVNPAADKRAADAEFKAYASKVYGG